jgi:hypothetical protein
MLKSSGRQSHSPKTDVLILIPNVKCIAWNFDGSNFVGRWDGDEALGKLRFENGDTIPNVKSYFSE